MIAALLALAVAVLLTLVLPVLSWLRASEARAIAGRTQRKVLDLELALRVLEARLSPTSTARGAPDRAPGPGSSPEGAAVTSAEPPGLAREVGRSGLERAPARAEAPPPAADLPPVPRPTAAAADTAADLETRIGARWMLYLGVATLVIGIGLFVRHAFENQWITESMRVAIGALAGVGLIVSGIRFVSHGYGLYGQMLSGGGLAALYVSTYAAFNLYALIGRGVAFALLVAITALAAGLADRQRSQSLAIMAIAGGFAAPFMVASGADAQVTLFTYVAILIAGTVYLARRRGWPALHLISFVLTWVTVIAWAERFFAPSKYLATELFLTLYCVMFLVIQRETRRLSHGLAPTVTRALWAAPALYHVASLVILVTHAIPFLIYLIAFSLAGLMLGARSAAPWVRLLLWTVVAVPLYGWLVDHTSQPWFWPALTALVALFGMHLAAEIEVMLRARRSLEGPDVALVPANALWLYGGLYALLEPRFFHLAGLAAALVALGYAGLAAALRRAGLPSAIHLRVVAFALAAVAVAVQFDGPWVTVLWAGEAAGILWVGLEERRDWVRLGGALLLGVAVWQLLDLLLTPVPSGYRVIGNQRVGVALFLIGVLGLIAWLHARRREGEPEQHPREVAAAVVAANVLAVILLTTEIDAFWSLRAARSGLATTAELARQVTISVTWAAYAALLLAAGFQKRYAPVRYLALGLFGLTVLKVFTVDLSQLDSIYRILSSVGLGALLVGASYLYHRYRSQLAVPPG